MRGATVLNENGNVVEPLNQVLRQDSAGLHPQSATRCVNVEGWMRQNYASTIANWNTITAEHKAWWIRNLRKLEAKGVKL